MNRDARRQVLSDFLKNKRARTTPEAVGIPPGSRRRTPGLRREEVAQLADVSTTWYTWLEQGRDIQVSASVLDGISAALQLNADEKRYLFSLAFENTADKDKYAMEAEGIQLSSSLQKMMSELKYCPVLITDRKCNIVGWNKAAAYVFVDFERIPPEERNVIRLLFTRQEFRRLAVNWEQFSGGFLSMFRSYYGQYVDDQWYEQFITEMMETYPEFRQMWGQSEVSYAPDVHLEFRHAKAGKMVYELTSLQVYGADDLRCSIYTPTAGTSTEAKLQQLLEPYEQD